MKTILITGSTDGLGLAAARSLVADGHQVLLHGRSAEKLEGVAAQLKGDTKSFVADLSQLTQVKALANQVSSSVDKLDALINNAGVFKVSRTSSDGLDTRFMVNTVAPYLLTKELLPLLQQTPQSRVINLSSAAQAPVNLKALAGKASAGGDSSAYAMSKLAITMWTRSLANELGEKGPAVVAINPGSFLGTKMVKEAFGAAGKDINIGVDILRRAVLSDEFSEATGRYFDNDSGHFADPHRDALDNSKCSAVTSTIESVISERLN